MTKVTFQATERKAFRDGNKSIIVEIENTEQRFVWRLIVDSSTSRPMSHYPSVLKHRGYCIATAYWAGTFPEFIPFRCKNARKAGQPS